VLKYQLSKRGSKEKARGIMVTYIGLFIVVAVLLISAVIVHMSLGFHRNTSVEYYEAETQDEMQERDLHDVIFAS